MKYFTYRIEVDEDDPTFCDVYRVNVFGFKSYLGSMQVDQAHKLFF